MMGRIGRFICPACNTVNVQSGNCFKCGADLEPPEDDSGGAEQYGGEQPAHVSHHADHGGRALRSMQTPLPLTRQQMIMIATGVLLLVAIFMMMGGGQQAPPPATAPTPGSEPGKTASAPGSVDKAIAIATRYAGFKDVPPPDWVFEDSSEETGGTPSFAMKNERAGQRVVFLVWDNQTPVDNLELLLYKVPFSDYDKAANLNDVKVATGKGLVGGGHFPWFVGRYYLPAEKRVDMVFIGAYRSPIPGKAIVVLARPLPPPKDAKPLPGQPVLQVNFDYTTTSYLVDAMAAGFSQSAQAQQTGQEAAPEAKTEAKPFATADELEAYRKKVESILKANFKLPKDAEEAKVAVSFGVTEEGKITKLEIEQPSGKSSVDQAVIKAVTNSQPFPPAPHTKDSAVTMAVTTDGDKLELELR